MYTVYVHIFPNGKRYYGATNQSINRRWRPNGEGYKTQPCFMKVIQKYRWDNIQHIVVAKGLTKEEAYWLEIELIKAWDTTNPDKGYNLAEGGLGCKGYKHTEDAKKKLSTSMNGKYIGKNHPQAKSIICITTGRIFDTARDGAKYYGMSSASNITKCCRGKQKSAGKLNGTKLVWKYITIITL